MDQPIKPMLAKISDMPSNQAAYAFEIKWDGLRAGFYSDGKSYRLLSRNMNDLTAQYPELKQLAEAVYPRQLIVDGEIVAFDAGDRPSFSRLQKRMGLTTGIQQALQATPVVYIIFDLLYLDCQLLIELPYTERRRQLSELHLSGPSWQTPDYSTGNGPALAKSCKQLGLEGVIAKKIASPYQPDKRTGAWLKIKNHYRQELVLGGWIPGEGNRVGKIGSLLTGYYDTTPDKATKQGTQQKLIYAGAAGTGFNGDTLKELGGLLTPLRRQANPFVEYSGKANALFVEPRLVAEFEFTEWTPHHTMRHPVFKGLRNDKDPRKVIRETPERR